MCGANLDLKLELQGNRSCNIYSDRYICSDCFNIFNIIYHSIDWIKDKKLKILNKNCLSFPTQQQRTESESNFSILWLFLATVACYLNCLSVRSLHTHSEHWQNLQNFFSLPPLNKHNTFHAAYLGLSSQLYGIWLFPIDTHSSHEPTVCLYNDPLSTLLLKYVLTIPFPTQCRYRQPWRLT